jgi:hypothetical protein
MLRKIQGAKATIQSKDLITHETKHAYLKRMVSDGSKRYSIVQAARQMILSQEMPQRRLRQHSQKWNRGAIKGRSPQQIERPTEAYGD